MVKKYSIKDKTGILTVKTLELNSNNEWCLNIKYVGFTKTFTITRSLDVNESYRIFVDIMINDKAWCDTMGFKLDFT